MLLFRIGFAKGMETGWPRLCRPEGSVSPGFIGAMRARPAPDAGSPYAGVRCLLQAFEHQNNFRLNKAVVFQYLARIHLSESDNAATIKK